MNGPQHCLVTGAAGFIGSHLVDRLLARGATVIGVDNLALGRLENLAAALRHERFRFVELDVNDRPRLESTLRNMAATSPIDMAWHLAANSDIRAGVADPDVDLHATFLTTHHLLQVMRALPIPQLAFSSTSAIYGVHPGRMTEELGPLFPISNYGAMKLASEAAISAALEAFLKRAWIFRFPNVVGSRSTHGVIYDFVQKLKRDPTQLEVLGDGLQEKPYFHVSDLVDAMLFITEHAAEPLNYYNIGTDNSVTTVREIAETVVRAQAPGARIYYTGGSKGWVGDVPKFNYSIEKLGRLGWKPRLTSNAAVERAVQEIVTEAARVPEGA
jgi:UDP-glucose 4-epimerase